MATKKKAAKKSAPAKTTKRAKWKNKNMEYWDKVTKNPAKRAKMGLAPLDENGKKIIQQESKETDVVTEGPKTSLADKFSERDTVKAPPSYSIEDELRSRAEYRKTQTIEAISKSIEALRTVSIALNNAVDILSRELRPY